MEEIPVEELVKKGKMVKSPFLMSPEERTVWKYRPWNTPGVIYFLKDGRMIAEHADGRIEYLD